MQNPITRHKYRMVIYLCIWFLITLFQYFISSRSFPQLGSALFWASIVQNFMLATLFMFSWYGLRYINLETQNSLQVILNHLAYMVVILSVWFFVSRLTDSWILKEMHEPYNSFIPPVKLLIGIFSYLLFISFIYFDGYYNSYLDKLKTEKELFTVAKEAELKMLKSQLNPHFIFNSLNSISSLTMTNPDKAQEMIIRLSDFLRYTVKSGTEQWVLLSEEIENLKAYLEIEKIRFGEKIQFHFEIDKNSETWEVPSMILQPLFENAIKHGVYQSLENEQICLQTHIENHFLTIRVENSFPNAKEKAYGTQTGLKNMKERLDLIYERKANLQVEIEENRFIVTLTLPHTQ